MIENLYFKTFFNNLGVAFLSNVNKCYFVRMPRERQTNYEHIKTVQTLLCDWAVDRRLKTFKANLFSQTEGVIVMN